MDQVWRKQYKPLTRNCSSVQSLSRVRLFATPWITARQASLSITNSRSSPKLMSIESVMPSSHLILCRPLLLLPSIPPSIESFPMSQLFAWGGQSILFHILSHYDLSQDIECSSLCYTVGTCCLSILYIIVCSYWYQSQTPNPSLPQLVYPLATTSLFSVFVNLFLFCRYEQLCRIEILHTCDIIWYLSFPSWLTSLSTIISSCIQVAANGIISFYTWSILYLASFHQTSGEREMWHWVPVWLFQLWKAHGFLPWPFQVACCGQNVALGS